jgi:hypothetical protein
MSHEQNCNSAAFRAHQRRWLAVLCAATGLAIIQQVVFPQHPPLPVPPDSQRMPLAWRSADISIAFPHQSPTIPHVATGPTQRFSKGTEWLLLTPLGSWVPPALDPARITSSMPELLLREPKLLSLKEKSHQIAIGRFQSDITYQTCLTNNGIVAFTADKLRDTSGRRHKDFMRTLINGRLSSSPRPSYSCLLITTNSNSLLNGSADSKRFLRDLTTNTQWPL